MARAVEIDSARRTAARTAFVIAAVILAAGASARMGTPKAMLPFRGGTFLSNLCQRLARHCEPVLVVTGAHAGQIQCPPGARAVVNAQWELGQLNSLQCGLRALPAGVEGVLFTLVDHPDPAEETLTRLAASQALVAVPVHEGRKGHPVWFRAELIPEFLALTADASAKDVFRAHAGQTDYIAVADPGIADDVDDAAALLRFRARTEFA